MVLKTEENIVEGERTDKEIRELNNRLPEGDNSITFLRSRNWQDQITPSGRFKYWKKRGSNTLYATWAAIEEELTNPFGGKE